MTSPFEEVMSVRGKGMPADGEVSIVGKDPILSTRFKIGDVCASVVAGVGVAVNDIWEQKTGTRQTGSVDVKHAAAALKSTRYMRKREADGTFKRVVNEGHEQMIQITQPWPTKDGKWFLPHFGLPNLRARVLDVLGCEFTPEAVRDAVSTWDALDLEAAIDEARACGAMVRSNEEWLAHPHGQALSTKPIVEVIKIGESDPEPFDTSGRPLTGIRALDLTRILAGPIAARTLAEHGAEVLMITEEGLPQIKEHVIDTSHGKRSSYLNLKSSEGAGALHELIKHTDVFSQGYRPSMLSELGFGPEQLAEARPGIVYVSISCFGAGGPFSHRAGWEQVAQTVTGICKEGSPERPKLLPAAACDYTTGYLGAYGALLALARRAKEGGSYHVRVSLCQSGMFIYRQGKTDPVEDGRDLSDAELDLICTDSETHHGVLRHLAPVLQLSSSQPHWTRPTPVLGASEPIWRANRG